MPPVATDSVCCQYRHQEGELDVVSCVLHHLFRAFAMIMEVPLATIHSVCVYTGKVKVNFDVAYLRCATFDDSVRMCLYRQSEGELDIVSCV